MTTAALPQSSDLPPDPECLMIDTIPHVDQSALEHLQVNGSSIAAWSSYYIRLGLTLSQLTEGAPPTDGLTLNLAISAPTRAYAATFINLGLQIGLRKKIITSFNKDTYFSDIKATPVNSELRYYEKPQLNGNSRKRIFRGTETDERGIEWLLLQDKRNPSLIDRVNASRSYCVLKDEQKGIKSLKSIMSFLEAIECSSNIQEAVAYTFNTRANVAIIGKINTLTEESNLSIGIQKDNINTELLLQEITRTGTQTLLLSSMRDENINQLNEQQPPIVIYESVSAAIKYKDTYSPKIRLHLVDRSSPSCRDYRTCIQEGYLGRDQQVAPKITTISPGIETLSFYSY
jgi:hypothetical protein